MSAPRRCITRLSTVEWVDLKDELFTLLEIDHSPDSFFPPFVHKCVDSWLTRAGMVLAPRES